VRLYSRNAIDWTARLPAIATAARRIKAESFTIDGEAVVLGPNGLALFDELRRREAALNAIVYAFDLIEHDGDDLRNRPLLDRNPASIAVQRERSEVWNWRASVRRTIPPRAETTNDPNPANHEKAHGLGRCER
jgi:ATP dependent DNA ligase domain